MKSKIAFSLLACGYDRRAWRSEAEKLEYCDRYRPRIARLSGMFYPAEEVHFIRR